MNHERVGKLVETLEWLRDTPELPEGTGFNICTWKHTNCQTTYCLAGWYAVKNPESGLRFVLPNWANARKDDFYLTAKEEFDVAEVPTEVLAEHFDLPGELMEALFLGEESPVSVCSGQYGDRVAWSTGALKSLNRYMADPVGWLHNYDQESNADYE